MVHFHQTMITFFDRLSVNRICSLRFAIFHAYFICVNCQIHLNSFLFFAIFKTFYFHFCFAKFWCRYSTIGSLNSISTKASKTNYHFILGCESIVLKKTGKSQKLRSRAIQDKKYRWIFMLCFFFTSTRSISMRICQMA